MSKKIDPLYDVGPPYVSPREGNAHGTEVTKPYGSVEDLVEVVEALTVRVYVDNGVWPGWFMEKHGMPGTYEELPVWLRKAIEDSRETPDQPLTLAAAHLVKMDHWTDLCRVIEEWLAAEGYRLKNSESSTKPPDIEFVERIACTADTHQEIKNKFEQCFQAKYFHKVLRPVAKIMKYLSVDGKHKASFHSVLQTYPHPEHWADPAGHSADAGITAKGIIKRWNIPVEVADQVTVGCMAFGFFRTFSLMHLADENLKGFQLGRS